jgi:hypothetical protein
MLVEGMINLCTTGTELNFYLTLFFIYFLQHLLMYLYCVGKLQVVLVSIPPPLLLHYTGTVSAWFWFTETSSTLS